MIVQLPEQAREQIVRSKRCDIMFEYAPGGNNAQGFVTELQDAPR